MKNIQKAIRYLKKNGMKKMLPVAIERFLQNRKETYTYQQPDQLHLAAQRAHSFLKPEKISVVVPAFETKAEYLKTLIDSMLAQSYTSWELVIADASQSSIVSDLVGKYQDERIQYHRLSGNAGIAENTNEAIALATGTFIGLLDHDDYLTPDALFEMQQWIDRHEEAALVYSDEDKTDGENRIFYEPNQKSGFNLDLFLSNNYLCHFTVIRAEYCRQIPFRSKMDGAQDYDLFLRIIQRLLIEEIEKGYTLAEAQMRLQARVGHIGKVLYHWRCHTGSTAQNPDSKRYAYEAGRVAVEEFIKSMGWNGCVHHTDHLGFYRVEYEKGIFSQRPDLGAIGGNLFQRGRVSGGAMNEEGKPLFLGLPKSFSGRLHRAVLQQQVAALDLRNIMVRQVPQIQAAYEEAVLKTQTITDEMKQREISLEFCEKIREMGYVILYDPALNQQSSEGR